MARKGKKAALVANTKQLCVMRVVQGKECREVLEAIGYRNVRHKRLMSLMERKRKLMGEVPQFRERLCLELGVLDNKIMVEELDLLEEAGDGGALDGKEKYRSRGVERHI